jgi:hypothetical protein
MTNERIIPLARDAEGRVTSVPDEAVGWRVFRHTGGRPRAELGDDGQPLRLPLGATQEDLAAVVSPGTYRLRPMTEAGELVGVGVDHDVAPFGRSVAAVDARESTFAAVQALVAANVEMARANAELVRSSADSARHVGVPLAALAQAQAEWIASLASNRALPRNGGRTPAELGGAVVAASTPPASVADEVTGDEEDDDEPDVVKAIRQGIDAIGGVQNLPHVAGFVVEVVGGIKNKFVGGKGTES